MDKQNITVLRKILYAVESGDQVYGKQDYSCFAGVGANCSNEKAITIGAGQWYAGEAKELLYRGYTHWTMILVGGMCFLFCGSVNEFLNWDMLIWKQMLACAVGITAIEFLSGYILNIILGLGIWDYSGVPLNILGQICLLFTVVWYILSLPAIILDDYLRFWIFGEEKPRYKWR